MVNHVTELIIITIIQTIITMDKSEFTESSVFIVFQDFQQRQFDFI